VFRQRNLQFALRKMFDENCSPSLFLGEDIVFVVVFVEEAFVGFFRLWGFCRWFALLLFILLSVVVFPPQFLLLLLFFFAFGQTKKGGRRIRESATRAKLSDEVRCVGGFYEKRREHKNILFRVSKCQRFYS
jgi:hypothetical protein